MNDLIERLKQSDGQLDGEVIYRIREGCGIEVAKAVVNLKAAAQDAAHALTEAASALQGKYEEIARLEGELRSRDLSPSTEKATPKSAAPDLSQGGVG